MTSVDRKEATSAFSPVDYFYYGKFCYTNLEDAVAEAKRHPSAC
jgi:hypothetical protein